MQQRRTLPHQQQSVLGSVEHMRACKLLYCRCSMTRACPPVYFAGHSHGLSCMCLYMQGAVAAVERRHADELREELQDTRDLCNFYQQENEELNMVSMLYQRQLDQLKQQQQMAAPPPGGPDMQCSAVCAWGTLLAKLPGWCHLCAPDCSRSEQHGFYVSKSAAGNMGRIGLKGGAALLSTWFLPCVWATLDHLLCMTDLALYCSWLFCVLCCPAAPDRDYGRDRLLASRERDSRPYDRSTDRDRPPPRDRSPGLRDRAAERARDRTAERSRERDADRSAPREREHEKFDMDRSTRGGYAGGRYDRGGRFSSRGRGRNLSQQYGGAKRPR